MSWSRWRAVQSVPSVVGQGIPSTKRSVLNKKEVGDKALSESEKSSYKLRCVEPVNIAGCACLAGFLHAARRRIWLAGGWKLCAHKTRCPHRPAQSEDPSNNYHAFRQITAGNAAVREVLAVPACPGSRSWERPGSTRTRPAPTMWWRWRRSAPIQQSFGIHRIPFVVDKLEPGAH